MRHTAANAQFCFTVIAVKLHRMLQEASTTYVMYLKSGESRIIDTLDEALDIWNNEPEDDRILWVDLFEQSEGSSPDQLDKLSDAFGLHPLAVEDTQEGNQRTKFEGYGDSNFMVLRPASIKDANTINLSELEIFVGPGYLITVHRNDPPAARRKSESSGAPLTQKAQEPAHEEKDFTLRQGFAWQAGHLFESIHKEFSEAVRGYWAKGAEALSVTYALLHQVLDAVVDSYSPILDSLEDTADAQEDLIFSGTPIASHDVYALSRGVLDLDRAIKSLPVAMQALTEYSRRAELSDEMMRNLRDVSDHVQIHADRLERLRSIMHEVFSANSTLIAERQGDQTKKISAWAGILFIPSLIAGVYGMNFSHMPELKWYLGYPFALLLMLIGSGIMYAIFKFKDWV